LALASPIDLTTLTPKENINGIDTPRILLGQISDCEGFLPNLCTSLSTLDLGPAAEPGEAVVLSRATIETALKLEYPGQTIAVHFPEQWSLMSRSRSPDVKEIDSQLRQLLNFALEKSGYRLEIEELLVVGQISLPAWEGKYEFPGFEDARSLHVEWFYEKFLKQKKIDIQFRDERRTYPFELRMKAQLTRQVPVAGQNLPRGARISSSDLTTTELPYDPARRLIFESESIIGKDLTRNLRAGEAFRPGDLRQTFAVRKGDAVKVHFQNGALKLMLDGLLTRAANTGDEVEVEITAGRKKVRGTLTSEGEVLVKKL
jgi:flagella basal body P-ring formation protein FlgA